MASCPLALPPPVYEDRFMLQVANTYPDLSVFITPELSRRPSRSVDLRREKVAIHDVATHMLEAP
jgi:hypothetical protein